MESIEELSCQKPNQPTTIEELKLWYEWHNLPPEEVTRFFIGKNIEEPKAFGIYKNEEGDCVVYKNKANGERAIRYQGADEAFAVGELLQRLKDEIIRQKAKNRSTATMSTDGDEYEPSQMSTWDVIKEIVQEHSKVSWVVFCLFLGLLGRCLSNEAPDGYYYYEGNDYYHQSSQWYYFDKSLNDWVRTEKVQGVNKKNASQYSQPGFFKGKQFTETQWYHDNDSYDWDSGDSWDSNSTDWDSDW